MDDSMSSGDDVRVTVDVRARGAVGDGIANDTFVIQRMIDYCSTCRGGGVVVIPAGRYRVGTLFMRDGVTLHLEDQASLLASSDRNDIYMAPVHERKIAGIGLPVLIYGESAHNIAITGAGTIDGQDLLYWDVDKSLRPRMVVLNQCSDVTISDVTFSRSSIYTIFLVNSQRLTVRDIRVFSGQEARNTDGIHVESCTEVDITGCGFVVGDDAIAIDGTGVGPSERITVRNCWFDTSTNAVRIYTGLEPWGVPTAGDNVVREVLIEDLDVHDAAGCINIVAQSGAIEDITVRNVRGQMRRTGVPVFMMTDRGRISAVQITDVRVRGDGALTIVGGGGPGDSIAKVVVTDCHFEVRPSGKTYGLGLPDGVQSYPVYHEGPYNVYLRDADDVTLDNVSVTWAHEPAHQEDLGAIKAERVDNLVIDRFRAEHARTSGDAPVIDLTEVKRCAIRGAVAAEAGRTYLHVAGPSTERITIDGVDGELAWTVEPDVTQNALQIGAQTAEVAGIGRGPDTTGL